MKRTRFLGTTVAILVVLTSLSWAVGSSTAAPGPATAPSTDVGGARHPMAEAAELAFFKAFNEEPEAPEAALRDLMVAYYIDPEDSQTNRLIGLNHLWLAAEGDRQNARTIEHLYLAEAFLARTVARDPDDTRMASWLLPTKASLAVIEQEFERVTRHKEAMVEAYETDPNFHSFVVGLQAFDEARDDPRFQFALEAMRAAVGCLGSGDPSCENRPRWPHNLEGFLVFAADFELKAGHPERAKAMLEQVQLIPEYGSWPYRRVVDERLDSLLSRAARYANEDLEDDPPSLFTDSDEPACQTCHRGE